MFVPVVDSNQKPLMPTTPSRARKWISNKKATGFWKRGVFCVRLNVEPSDNKKQEVTVGIDTGSKREAFTVKSTAHTYLNVLTEAVTWVKESMTTRREIRRNRRMRKTPCRKNKYNKKMGGLAPSTKARWQWKLRILHWFEKMFPIVNVIVEDIRAKMIGKRRWDRIFGPLQYGKHWFYLQIKKTANLITKQGRETNDLRNYLGLKKSNSKLADKFECHNVDSWVLANSLSNGHTVPDNKKIIKIVPLQFHRRQLHVFQPHKGGGKRKFYGGTRSLGFTRGSLVKHKKYGLVYVGGTSNGNISVHNVNNGKRIYQKVKTKDVKFLSYNSWRLDKKN